MVDGVEWWGPVTAISGAAVAVVAIAAAITRPFKSIRDEARQAHVLIGENINAVRIDLAAKIDGVRTDLTAKIDGVRTELQADIKAVDAKVDGVRTDLTDLAKDVGELRVQVGRIDERTKASTEYRHAGTARVTDEPPS